MREDAREAMSIDEAFRAHRGFVNAALLRMGVGCADAPDAVQEVFLVAHRRQAQFRGDSKFTTWLFAISLRVAAAYRRRRGRRAQLLDDGFVVVDEPPVLMECSIDRRRAARQVEQALDKLSVESRILIERFVIRGESMAQIAQSLGCPVKTAYSRYYLARAELRAAIPVDRRVYSFGWHFRALIDLFTHALPAFASLLLIALPLSRTEAPANRSEPQPQTQSNEARPLIVAIAAAAPPASTAASSPARRLPRSQRVRASRVEADAPQATRVVFTGGYHLPSSATVELHDFGRVNPAAIKPRLLWPRDNPAIQSTIKNLSSEGFSFIDADSLAAR